MMYGIRTCIALLAVLIVGVCPLRGVQAQSVQDVQPNQNSVVAQATDTVSVEFESPITVPSTTDTISVSGSRFGTYDGTVAVSPSSIEFISDCPFRPGETVTVTVPAGVGGPGDPFVWQFTVRSEYGQGQFSPEDTVRVSGADAQFEPRKLGTITVPSTPYAGYLNDDLRGDVAVVNQETESVTVRYGAELDGSSAQTVSVPGATTLAGGDINGDGRPDLVTAHTFEDSLGVVVNNGSEAPPGVVVNNGGTFQLDGKIPTGARPTDIVVADLNGNGAQDLAVTPFGENSVYVHLNENNGRGEFRPPQVYDSGAGPSSIAARDIDNDGDLDLLVGSTGDQTIEWLENDGAAGFTQSGSIDLGFVPSTLVANDVVGNDGSTTGDGWVDIIVTGQEGNQTLLYENDGTPSFNFTERSISSPDEPATGTALADIDGREGEYDLDLISGYRSSFEIGISENNSNNGYAGSETFTASNPVGVVGLDVDRDGDQDIVSFNTTGKVSQLFKNEGGREGPIELDKNLLSYGDVCVGDQGTAMIEVENISNNDVEITASSVPPVAEVATSLPITLRPDETRELEVVFTPPETGSFDESLLVVADEKTERCGQETPPEEYPVRVRGRGIDAQVSATPDTLDFGEIVVGDTSTESFEVRNQGNIDAQVVDVLGLDGTPFAVPNPPSSIPRGGQEAVTAEFSPTTDSDDFTETVRLVTDSQCGQDTVSVVLTGSSRPQRPDLVAEQVVVDGDPGTIAVSDERNIACEFSNRGGMDVETDFAVRLSRGGTEVGTFAVSAPLSVDETRQTGFVTVPFPNAGSRDVTCEVDPNSAVNEGGRTANNRETRTFTVEAPDLVAEEVVVDGNPGTIEVKDELDVACGFGNQGGVGVEEDFSVRISQDGTTRRTFTASAPVSAGESRQTNFVTVPFPEQGSSEVTCEVDPDAVVGEGGRTDNNEVTRSFDVQLPDQLPVSPNPFTPNGDGINDVVRFKVGEFGLDQPTATIYEFEGRAIRTLGDVQGGELRWDGTDDSGEQQPPGVYLFVVRDGGQTAASGHVTLAR